MIENFLKIVKSIDLSGVPIYLVGLFVLFLFILFLFVLFLLDEEKPPYSREYWRKEFETPEKIIEELKYKYKIEKTEEGISWFLILFAFIFLSFIVFSGFIFGKYLNEAVPRREEFVSYFQRVIIQPIVENIKSKLR